MGQAESTPGAPHHDPLLGSLNAAFHVLRVAEGSPAAGAGVDPFFDFIVGAAGRQLGDEIDALTDVLEHNEGREVTLQVYSTKRHEVRDVHVVPSRSWSSEGAPGGQVDGQPSLLGLSLRLCNPQHALEQVWHVLEILEGSPAQSAGLVPFGDWIIGYAGGVLCGEGDFYDVVEAHVDKPLRLFVYNSDYDVTREAILVPNRSWGGEGLLGCGVGYGLLHRIPKPQDRPRLPPHAAVGVPPPPPQAGASSPQRYAAPPPPRASSDRLNSFSSTGPLSPSKNPLYAAPPPPRASAAPPPPRRTAALAMYDEEDEDRTPVPGHSQQQQQQHYPQPSSDNPYGDYPSHPSFAYEHPSFSSSASGGAYDATEGVEVVPAGEEGYGGADDFVSPSRTGGYGQGGYGRGYGGYAGGGVATVIAEEAE
ncbi:hypothetical protein JCM10213_001094 [Rhodosporidiobolus nylandii]